MTEYMPTDALRLLAVGISDDQACGHCDGTCGACQEDAASLLARVKRDAAREALDGLAAAEHRATRAEAQSEARQINAEYWRHRAIKCAARALGNDHPPDA